MKILHLKKLLIIKYNKVSVNESNMCDSDSFNTVISKTFTIAENNLDVSIVDSGKIKRKYEDKSFGSQTHTKRPALELNKTVPLISSVGNKKSAGVICTRSKEKIQVSKEAKNSKHKAETALSTLKIKPCSIVIKPINIHQFGDKSTSKLSKVTNFKTKSKKTHNTRCSSNFRKERSVVNTKQNSSNELIKPLKPVDSPVSDERLDSCDTLPMNRVVTTKDFINANISNLGNKGRSKPNQVKSDFNNLNQINEKQHVSKQMNSKSTDKNISSKIQTGSTNAKKRPLFEQITVTDFITRNLTKLSQTNSTVKESRSSTFKPSKNSDQENISHSKESLSVETDSQVSHCLTIESVSTNEGISPKGNNLEIILNTNITPTNLNSTSYCHHRQPDFSPNELGIPAQSNSKPFTITDKSNESQKQTEFSENHLIVPNLFRLSNSPNLTVSVFSSGQQSIINQLNMSLLPNQMNSLKVQTNLENLLSQKNLVQILQKPDSVSNIARNNAQTQILDSRDIKEVVEQVNQQNSSTNSEIWFQSKKISEKKKTSSVQISTSDKTLSSSHYVSISEKHPASTVSSTLSQSQSVSLRYNLSSSPPGGTTINNTIKSLTSDHIANCDSVHKVDNICLRKKNRDLEELDGAPPFIQEVFKCGNIRDGFNNADLIFVLSLLPDIEEMTDAQKRTFQIMVIESLKSVFDETQK